jgi:hypothetical protein
MAADRLGVRGLAVSVVPLTGAPQQKVLDRLDVMERELKHVHTAIKDMRNAVRQARPGAPLASAVMNSRNWVVSVLMSHAYVQQMLAATVSVRGPGTVTVGPGAQGLWLKSLAERAVEAGMDDAQKDRP